MERNTNFSKRVGFRIRTLKSSGGLELEIVQHVQARAGPLLAVHNVLASLSDNLRNKVEEVIVEQNIQLPNDPGDFTGVRLDWLPEGIVVRKLKIVQHIPLLNENQHWTCVSMSTNLVQLCWKNIETSLHIGISKGTWQETVYDRYEF